MKPFSPLFQHDVFYENQRICTMVVFFMTGTKKYSLGYGRKKIEIVYFCTSESSMYRIFIIALLLALLVPWCKM